MALVTGSAAPSEVAVVQMLQAATFVHNEDLPFPYRNISEDAKLLEVRSVCQTLHKAADCIGLKAAWV